MAYLREIFNHPRGLALFGRRGGEIDLTAGDGILLKYSYLESALREYICRHESRRTRADNNCGASVAVLYKLFALVTDKRVDGTFAVTADKRIFLHRFDAVEAADAATHCLAVNGFLRPVRVGNVRSAEGNEVLSSVLELLFRLLGRADKVSRDDGD